MAGTALNVAEPLRGEEKRPQPPRRLEGEKGSQTAGSTDLLDLKGFDWMGGGDLSHGGLRFSPKKHQIFRSVKL